MAIEFSRTIRGQDVDVFADSFTEDQSVGIGLGPEEVWAELDGKPFELTDQEIEDLGIEATQIYLDRDDAADMADLRGLNDG